MAKQQPAAPQVADGGEPRSRSRSSGAAPSTRGAAPQPQPPPARHREESVRDVRHAVAPSDGAAVPAGGRRPAPHARFVTYKTEVRSGREPLPEQSPVHGDGAEASARTPQRRPSYQPPWQRRIGDGQPQAAPPPRPASRRRASVPEHPLGPAPAPAVVPMPEGARPPINTQKTIQRTSTITDDDGAQVPGAGWQAEQPQPPRTSPATLPSPHQHPEIILRHPKEKGKQPMAFCFTACCILFWLLVIALGSAVLIIFLLYHPQSPKMRVTSATLNAGYVDELGGGAGGGELGSTGGPRALNADLTVLAAIYNPNTKLHVVLSYMQLDLYFEGSMIATQAVWPAPLHEGPRGSVLRSVHLVVSEVTVTQEDVSVWQNATAKGGPVVLHLAGRFRTVLIFGRWFRYKYWVRPQCTLWLDPPPSGALRHARC